MKKPNFLDVPKQKGQPFHWPVWFPYPSSWLRALILVPIALPGTHLIVFGLTGVIISVFENSPLLLSFSILFGLLLPTVVLAFFYHFVWHIWQRRSSKTSVFSVIPSCASIWQGLYTTFVLAFGFIIIVALFSELAFLDCKSPSIRETLNICTGRLTERAVKLIFSNIENKNFLTRPWFIIWIFTAGYLYQVEFLLRRWFRNRFKLLFKNKYKPLENGAMVLSDGQLQNDIQTRQIPKNKKQQRQILAANHPYYYQPKKNNLGKLLFYLLVLSGVGIYLFVKFPEMKNNLTLYISSPQISPKIKPHPDIFQKAINKAIRAGNLTTSANSQKEWKGVVRQWQAAIALMKNIPPSHPNYAIAQQQITEYKKNLGYSKKNTAPDQP